MLKKCKYFTVSSINLPHFDEGNGFSLKNQFMSSEIAMGANNSSLTVLQRTNNMEYFFYSSSSHSRGAHTPAINNLPPIVFHPVRGENVHLSRDAAVARRTESFCKGITFSNRPVRTNERVYLKFVETSTSWSGSLRFGFTTNDPANFRSGLPKYACPDLTNKPGNWAKALGERYAQRDTLLYYYVTDGGEVYFGLNGEDKGIFFSGVSTSGPLWALIDIYGNTVAVELVDPRSQLNNSQQYVDTLELESYLPLASLNIENNEQLPPLHANRGVTFASLPFHRTRGANISFSADKCIAERSDSDYRQGYVFSSRPLLIGERLVLQILQTEMVYAGALAFGLTSCNPNNLSTRDLPDDADNLLDRPEYWVVLKDVAGSPHVGDELAFWIKDTGEVQFAKNTQPATTIVHVDHTQPLWAFFDLYGNTLKVRMIGTTTDTSNFQNSIVQDSGGITPPGGSPPRVSSPTMPRLTVNLPPVKRGMTVPTGDGSGDWIGSECVVCCDQNTDSVLYSCGHMCMCYKCAVQQWKGEGGGQCPICRASIRDVIRIFRS